MVKVILVSALENKAPVDLSHLITKDELDGKHYLTEHQSLENYALKSEIPQAYNDANLKERVSSLEAKALSNGAYDDSNLRTRIQALETKEDKDTVYDDAEVKRRLSALESKPDVQVDTLVTKKELESKGYLTSHQSLDGYALKSELYNDAEIKSKLSLMDRTIGEQNTKISTLQSKAEYEIHGTGMPNGQVEAPIGTTYVDTAVTNGALKWIKQSGSGNTGWKVLIGDTGWRTLNSVSRAGNSFIKIRRVNNLVTYQFGGLQWGWFGVGRRNGPGFVRHNSSGDKGAKLTYPNGIPEGFRSENSLVGPTYDDKGRPYGIWYLGGKSDLNFIQFTFNENIPTDRDIGDIRVSAISYVTDEDWPTRLP